MRTPPVRSGRWGLLVLWLAAVAAVGALGAWVTLPKVGTWYAALPKPAFTPPNAVFGPAWSVLYVMMAVAAFRVSRVARSPARGRAIALFVLQLALNALWSPSFFGLEWPLLGLVVIVCLVGALLATMVAFWRLDRTAAFLLVPYLLWLGYATALNAAIVILE